MKYIKRILLGIFIFIFLLSVSVFVLIRFYKKEMASLLIDTLKTDYALSLKVEDAEVSLFANWPQASIRLKNVYLASDLYPNKNEPLLKAGSISLSFDLPKLLKKQFIVNSVSVKNAEIKLIKNVDGSRNFDFKKRDTAGQTSAPSSISFEINKVSIRNTQFNFINRAKKQNIDLHFVDNDIKLKHAQDGVSGHLSGEILVGGLLFNEKKGAYLPNTRAKTDLDFTVFYKNKMIVVHPSSFLTMDKRRYDVNAFIELGEIKKLMLRIESNAVDYVKGSRLLNAKLQNVLNNFTVEKPFALKALIIARIDIKEEPIVILNFDVKDNNVTIGNSKIPYSHVSFKGTILSLDSSRKLGNGEEGKIVFKTISGNLYDFPFTASVSITNLVTPTININAQLLVEASKIKYKVAQDFKLKGNCVAKVTYAGPTDKLNSKEFLGPDMHLNANLFFDNFSYQEKDKPYTYVAKGKANVNNRDLKFENLLLKMDGGDAILTGKAENFVNYVLGYGNSMKLTLDAKSDYININAYMRDKTTVPVTQTEQEKTVSNEAEHSSLHSSDQAKADRKQSMVDAGTGSFEFNAKLFAKKLIIRKVEVENASIDISHKNKLLNIK